MRTETAQAVQGALRALNLAGPGTHNASEWMRQCYPELRHLAAQFFRHERRYHTLQPTALVHEVFIRLSKHGPKRYAGRAHFFAVVARAMRQILVEEARRHRAIKRGGAWHRVPLEEAALAGQSEPDFLALDQALERLEACDPRLGRLFELRFFGGLSTSETAALLKRGESTIRRDWSIAKARLQRELECPAQEPLR